MLTNDDIKKIVEVVATKEDIAEIKEEISSVDARFEVVTDEFMRVESRFGKLENILENKADKTDVNNLTNAIDKLVKSVEDLKTEYSAVMMAIHRHETWLKQIADKVGIKLEF